MATPQEIATGADKIVECFNGDKPFFIGRNGSTEMELLSYWNSHRSAGWPWSVELMSKLERYSGIWPINPISIDKWCATYTSSLGSLNGLAAGWFKPLAELESNLLSMFAPKAFRTPLRSIEPYYVEPSRRWTAALADKDVAVVSCFPETIQAQLDLIDAPGKIWSNVDTPESLLPPSTRWHLVKTYFPPLIAKDGALGWESIGVNSWQEAVEHLVARVLETKATIAIIGCGALGIIIGAELKKKGVSVILMGGAIQVLFGIKGRRWATHDVISKFWNSAWTEPRASETPPNSGLIEGACYW